MNYYLHFLYPKKNKFKKKMELRKLKTENMDINMDKLFIKDSKKNSNIEKNLSYSKSKSFEQNSYISPNEHLNNLTYTNDKDYRFNYSEINKEKDKDNDIIKIFNKKENINFCKYLISNISFGKYYSNIKAFNNFQIKFISVENLLKCYLKINNLNKINKI